MADVRISDMTIAGSLTDGTLVEISMGGATYSMQLSQLRAFFGAVFAPLVSPGLTGNPTAPNVAAGDSSTKIANTAFVAAVKALLAPLASPTFTGTPTAPTPPANDSSSRLATTGFVSGTFAPLSNPAFQGTAQFGLNDNSAFGVLRLNGGTNGSGNLNFNVNGKLAWNIAVAGTDNLLFQRYDANGSYVDSPIVFNRGNASFSCAGAASFASTLYVASTATFNSGIVANNGVSSTGIVSSGGSSAAFYAFDRNSGNTGIGAFYRAGGINYLWDNTAGNVLGYDNTGKISLYNKLSVTGDSTLSGALSTAGAATFGSTLSATGNATFGGTLSTTGAATFGSTLRAVGDVSFQSALYLTGAASIGGALSVSGTSFLSNANIGTAVTVGGLNLNAPKNSSSNLSFTSNTTQKFALFMSGTESGGNAGANLYVGAYDDNGNYLGSPMQFNRAAMTVNFASRPTWGGNYTPYDSANLTAAQIATIVGYPSVQQGTGIGQTNNAIKIGFSSSGPKITVDGTDFGNLWCNGSVTTTRGSTGYIKYPNGDIKQWGYTSNPGSDFAVTFPVAFPNACEYLNLTIDAIPAASQALAYSTSDRTVTGFNVRPRYVNAGAVGVASQNAYWEAWGY